MLTLSVIEELLAEQPDSPIYHYTSNDGFLGIIQTKTLWATKLHYLNDSTEFAYAIGLVKENLNDRLRRKDDPCNDFYKKAIADLHSIEDVHIFVACFSEMGDLLSQWRGYCPNSVGYSIALDFTQLQEAMVKENFRLVRCVYNEERQRAIVDDLIASEAESVDQTSVQVASMHLIHRIPEVAPALKHPQFAEEREWRLVSKRPVSILNPQVRFRSGRWSLIPYYRFALCQDSNPIKVSHMYVGPNPHMKLAIHAAHAAVWNAKVEFPPTRQYSPPFDVRPSSVPYRGW